jgi:hypothetical protein
MSLRGLSVLVGPICHEVTIQAGFGALLKA